MPPQLDAEEEALNRFVRLHLRSPAAAKLRLTLRRYQVLAALKSYHQMIAGANVVLNLPTGTGKTMVANILSLLFLENSPSSRCLYLAPSRSLAFQHRRYSKWLAPKYQTLLLLEVSHSPEKLYTRSLRSHIIVSTPELCANLVRSRMLPLEVIESLCMVSVDEFDDHFVFGYTDSGPSARFDAQFQKLYTCLPRAIPVQLVSATDPKSLREAGSPDPVIKAFSALMDETYSPAVIEIPRRLYARHVPTARIQPVEVNEPTVVWMSWALSVEMALVFDKLFDESGLLLSRDDVLDKLEAILNHTITRIQLVSGAVVPLSLFEHRHFVRLRDLLSHHEHLYEDMFLGFDYEIRRTRIFSLKVGDFIMADLPRLVDRRSSREFHARLLGKATALLAVLESLRGQVGVLFSRKIRLSAAISERLLADGWRVVMVDSRFTDRLRDQRLQAFADHKYDVLIITRRTGRRGLDLPRADFAVYYSPKARETTTWQELSRIRSSVHSTKTSYFLSYSETADARRMSALLAKMGESGREYEFLPQASHGERYDQRAYREFMSEAGISDSHM